MEHKIQNEDKQNTIQHSKLKGQTRVDDPRDKGSMEHNYLPLKKRFGFNNTFL